MNDLTVTKTEVATTDFTEVATEYLRGMGMNVPQKYATQFIELCKAYSLNPFKRECYAVGYGDNWNIITGYEVYIKRAERTGKLDGWDCTIEGSGENLMAKLTIYRKDWSHPFHHFVLYREAVQKKRDGSINAMWAKMGSFMLRKVCIAQGFRLCFPDELGGMPYTSDELPEIEKTERNVTPVENTEINSTESVNEVSQKFGTLLGTYQQQLDQHYDMAYQTYQTGSDAEMQAMYSRCVRYLNKKGIMVA